MTRALLVVAAAVVREVGRALIDVADAVDRACGCQPLPPPERCPDFVPDALLVNR